MTCAHRKKYAGQQSLHGLRGLPLLVPGAAYDYFANAAALPPAAWDSREIDGLRSEPGVRRAPGVIVFT